ncbi:MAG: GNAT family N-acetyltransferase [Herpetosiphon sp.]
MGLFRRQPNWTQALVRVPRPEDGERINGLLNRSERRLLSSSVEEATGLLLHDPAMILEVEGRISGALGIGWCMPPVAWIRTVVLQSLVPIEPVLKRMLQPLLAPLRAEGTTTLAITVDDWCMSWLGAALERIDFEPLVDVIGYEKSYMDIPNQGNQAVVVRRAGTDDLEDVLRIDADCFDVPWSKGTEIFGPALLRGPCFWVVLDQGRVVGYAWATVHQGGRLVHLVRIAVERTYQDQAIGVRLLAEVVKYCSLHSTTLLTLNTQADNFHAQRLYEWFGFIKSGDRQRVYGYDLSTG